MKDFFGFLLAVIDNLRLWFWVGLIALFSTIGNLYLTEPNKLISSYGYITFGFSLALYLQNKKVTEYVSSFLANRSELRRQEEKIAYWLEVPCKEHAIIVAHCGFEENQIDKSKGVPLNLYSSIFYDKGGKATPVFDILVKKNLAKRNARLGQSILNDWLLPQFRLALKSSQENQAIRTLEQLRLHGKKLVDISQWADSFEMDAYLEGLRKLNS